VATNKEFAKENDLFRAACEMAQEEHKNLKPTKRQASKFRRGKGIAFKFKHAVKEK
jgi:hypothetical protein